SITFDPAVFATAQTVALTGGPLLLTDTAGQTSISGPAAGVTVSGGNATRVFQVDAGATVSLSGLTVSKGAAALAGLGDFGGGIANFGTLTLTGCTVSANSARSSGGGIFNFRTLTLIGCTVSANSARSSGGGIFNNGGTLTLTNCTVSANSASV